MLDEWLPMATVHGADALGVSRDLVTFKPGATPGILALKLSSQAERRLDETAAIEWLSTPPRALMVS